MPKLTINNLISTIISRNKCKCEIYGGSYISLFQFNEWINKWMNKKSNP